MPSAEQATSAGHAQVEPSTPSFLIHGQESYTCTTRDVDALVSRIKENLRLQSANSLKSRTKKNYRSSPYKLPCRRKEMQDDSYERFEALLRKGSLIKEAVKILEEDDRIRDSMDEDSRDEEDFLYFRNRRKNKQRACYYESEDDDYDNLHYHQL